MSELLVIKREEGFPLEINADALKLKATALERLIPITKITSNEELAAAALVLSEGATLVRQMEDARVDVKAPYLDAGRRIDDMAKEYKAPLEEHIARIKKLTGDWQMKEKRRIDAENAERERLAREEAARIEQARLAEEKRIRDAAEAEQALIREEAEEAVREREKATAEIDTDLMPDPFAALRARAAQAEEERLAKELEKSHAREAQALAEQEARALTAQSTVTVRAAAPPKVKGIASRTYWTFEVTSLTELVHARPDLCKIESSPSQINCRIREGLRECPGLRIFETTDTSIR